MMAHDKSMSIIHESVIFGVNVKIGRFCIIESNVTIGDNTVLSDYTYIGENSQIGSNCSIGFHAYVGNDVIIGDHFDTSAYCEIRSNCVIGSNVSMGSRCTLSIGTIVKDNVIMKYDFVATDTPTIGDLRKNTCILESGSKFGASVVIMPGVTIGENSEIGACSQVRYDVPPNEVWYGNPAKPLKR